MRKMYKAECMTIVLFVADSEMPKKALANLAKDSLREEMGNSDCTAENIKEIAFLAEVPNKWEDGIYYGDNEDDERVKTFFDKKNLQDSEEYQTYLKLKEKFDK